MAAVLSLGLAEFIEQCVNYINGTTCTCWYIFIKNISTLYIASIAPTEAARRAVSLHTEFSQFMYSDLGFLPLCLETGVCVLLACPRLASIKKTLCTQRCGGLCILAAACM